MQLQYAYVLQQLLPLITFGPGDDFQIELETGVEVGGRRRNVDLMFVGHDQHVEHRIAVEMKCYREVSASGGKRAATDIFMKDVYFDFMLLEQYVEHGVADEGVELVANDLERLVHPKSKKAKSWDYDISDGAAFGPINLTTPIGGKPVSIALQKSYSLQWRKFGGFWFLEAQGS